MADEVTHALSGDGYILTVKRRTPAGVQTATLHRERHAGPFTYADVAAALERIPARTNMQPGQRNHTHRTVTRYGTLWTHVMTGPPTWWLPKVRREKDGTVMAGWLRLAVAARFSRTEESGSDD